MPALAALETTESSASHSRQSDLPHNLLASHTLRGYRSHDCQSSGNGLRDTHDSVQCSRLLFVYRVEEQTCVVPESNG